MSRLAEILRRRRKELNLSAEEIAWKIGKSKRAYLYYEEDKEPRHDVLQKLAQVLQFDPSEVYENGDDFLQKTKSKTLNMEIENQKNANEGDYQGKYIALLEQNNFLLAEKIEKIVTDVNKIIADLVKLLEVKELANSNKFNLDILTRNHLTSHAMNEAFHEVILDTILRISNADPSEKERLIITAHNIGFQKRLELSQKGILESSHN